MDGRIRELNFRSNVLKLSGLYSLSTTQGPDSFYHATLNAYDNRYITSTLDGVYVHPNKIVEVIRDNLITIAKEQSNVEQAIVSRQITPAVIEFLSKKIEINIFVLDFYGADLSKLRYHDPRFDKSIVLLFIDDIGFETVAIKTDDLSYASLFQNNCELIKALEARHHQITKSR